MDSFVDGGEIAIVKAIGIGGGSVSGDAILDRSKNMDVYEAMDILKTLMDTGYVICDRDTFRDNDDFRKAEFHVNSGYTKALKKAVDPDSDSKTPKRIRRE